MHGRVRGIASPEPHDEASEHVDGRGEKEAPLRELPARDPFARTEDIVEVVGDGVADMGITGGNLLEESGRPLEVRAELHYGRCRLDAAVPSDAPAHELWGLEDCRVATSHPATVERFFRVRGIRVEIVPLSGAVEVAPRMGLADAIVDLVSTNSTLLVNGLRSVGTLRSSQAVLVARC